MRKRYNKGIVVRCTRCGKLINTGDYNMSGYVYKSQFDGKMHYFCGWNCQLSFERETEEATRRKRQEQKRNPSRPRIVDREEARSKALKLYLDGKTLKDIGDDIGVCSATVRAYLRECGYRWDGSARKYVKAVVSDGMA